ncbi:hypothetical protein RDWZM_002217 [Blomia tropicalis]|uniref:Glutathione S-transferase kappa n=1 Tax=Blomia tropicalis TaxID=40697 RepID=A0A9Q0MDN3_BLOTA|nr:hypothetical protein RDWZM_002217 [Blomia tropicalis]
MSNLIRRSFSTSSSAKTKVELFYDIISPFTYIQFELLTRQRKQWPSMDLRFTPTTIVSIMSKSENMPPMMVPAKGKYMMKDLQRISQFHKIPFKIPNDFPQFALELGSMKTQRFLCAVHEQIGDDVSRQEQLIRLFFQKFFTPTGERINLADVDTIRSVATEAGLESDFVQKAIDGMTTDVIKKKLIANSDIVTELGGFGLPVTVVHTDKEPKPPMIFGSDRLHLIGDMLGESKPPVLN